MANRVKRVTTIDVANCAGVSQTTVSLVLNGKMETAGISEETVRKVMDAAIKTGYLQPAASSNLTGMQNLTIGFIVPDLVNPCFTDMLSEASIYAASYNVTLLVCNTDRSTELEKEYAVKLANRGVDGVIYTFTPTSFGEFQKERNKTPIVIIGETDWDLPIATIGANSTAGGEMVAKYLYDLGHRKIAYITPPINSVSVLRKKRLDGITRFLENKGIKDSFYVYEQNSYMDWGEDSFEIGMGRAQTRELLKEHDDVTAIIAQGDLIAFGVYQAIKEAGLRIPDDISVISFDNTEYCNCVTPRLTSVDCHTRLRCKQAFEYLMMMIKGSENSKFSDLLVEYRPTIVERESIKKIRVKNKK